MAANDNALPQSDGDAADAPVAEQPEKQGSRLGVLIVTVVVLAALGGGAAVAFSQYDRLAQAASVFGGEPTDSTAVEAEPPEFGTFYQIQNMIVNPAGTDGRRYLMINVGFEGKEEAVGEELKQKEVVIRDLLLRRLGRRTVPELSDIEVRPEIKAELRDSVNALLVGHVNRLYFTQYVLQ